MYTQPLTIPEAERASSHPTHPPWNSRTRMKSFSFLSSHDLNGKAHQSRELMLLNDHYRALVEIIDSENTDHITGKLLVQCQKIFKDSNSRSSWLTLWHPHCLSFGLNIQICLCCTNWSLSYNLFSNKLFFLLLCKILLNVPCFSIKVLWKLDKPWNYAVNFSCTGLFGVC